MKDTIATRVIAGIYIALCAGLSREGARLANDCLLEFSSDPESWADEALLYRQLAESAQREPLPAKNFCWLNDLLMTADLHTAH